nr:MAG TPA: hypothetical protein [Caudoviricetes sp.]
MSLRTANLRISLYTSVNEDLAYFLKIFARFLASFFKSLSSLTACFLILANSLSISCILFCIDFYNLEGFISPVL